MANFGGGKKLKDTYKQVLHVGSLVNNIGLLTGADLKPVSDGEGNASPLLLSRDKVGIGSHVDVAQLLTDISTGLTNLSANLEALRTGAPEVLDTITELAAALGNNPNAITSILTALTGKVPTSRKINDLELTADLNVWESLVFARVGDPAVLICNSQNNTPNSATALVANTLRLVPISIPRKITVSAINVEVTTLVAATTIRLGIYSEDGNGYPLNLLTNPSAPLIASSFTGMKSYALESNLVLLPGKYFLAVSSNGAPFLRLQGSGGSALMSMTASFGFRTMYTPAHTHANPFPASIAAGAPVSSAAPHLFGLTTV